MSSNVENTDVDISVPENIESSTAKLIWLWLATNGAGTSEQISQAIDEPLSKVLPILSILKKQGAVERESAENGRSFVVC